MPHEDLLVDLVLADGSRVTTTEDHPYWNASDQAWQESQSLDAGDTLLRSDQRLATVVGLDWSTLHYAPAYDLDVDGIDTYFVSAGDTEVLVDSARAGHGEIIIRNLGDEPRLIDNYGAGEWVKMQQVARGTDGNATVHWFRNLTTNQNVEFKFTQRYGG